MMSEKDENWLDRLEKMGDELMGDVGNQVKRGLSDMISSEILGIFGGGGQPAPPPPVGVPPTPGPGPGVAPPGGGLFQKPPSGLQIEGMRENLGWSYGGNPGGTVPFTLSAQTDHFQYGEPIAMLNPGEFFVFNFRVIGVGEQGDFTNALEILAVDSQDLESGWVIRFQPGKDEVMNYCLKLDGRYDPENHELPSYAADQINAAVVGYDGKYLAMALNGKPCGYRITTQGGQFLLKTRVVGMGANFWG